MDRILVAVEVPQLGDVRRRHWAKLVKEVDDTKATGWAYLGDFVSDGGVADLPVGGLLLLYGERGSAQNPQVEAALYMIGPDSTLTLEQRATGRAWARTLRDRAGELLDQSAERDPDLSAIDSEFLAEELTRRGVSRRASRLKPDYPPFMVTLRLFAHLRELAGTSRVEVEGETVADVLAVASSRFGESFAAGLKTAAVWRNGESATMSDPVASGDELAVIPPVSGGSTTMLPGLGDSALVTGLVGLLLLIGTNLAPGAAWWAAGLVLLMALWSVDVAARLEDRGREPATLGILTAIVLAMISTHALGGIGLGMTLYLSVAVVLGWGVANNRLRQLTDIAPSILVALVATAGVGSLMLTRTVYESDQHAISIFILVVGLAAAVAAVLERMRTPILDPYSGTALAAVLGAALGALLWGEDVVGFVLVGLGMAVLLVVGRSLGSILRSGRVALADFPPGALGLLDGAMFAAVLYYPLVSVVL